MPIHRSEKPKPFLSLRQAAFRLGDRLVFENTTWTLHRDEQWALIGANGSGKSVLADGLRGCLPLVQGELRYHFQPPDGLAHEEAIGHVSFEDRKAEVHDSLVQSRWTSFEQEDSGRVKEFLSYERVMDINPFEISPRRAQARQQFACRLERAARLLQIKSFWSRTLLSLSNGERQRVQIARALARPLRFLILDDPYVGLDVSNRQHFHRILERLLETNLRVLLLTSRPEDLPQNVTHLLEVEDCRVIASGPRRTVLSASHKPTRRKKNRQLSLVTASLGGMDGALPQQFVSRTAKANTAAPRALVELRDVTVRYGATTILNRVSWTLREGESWALLGPNGSGKTTLLSLIQGDNPQAYTNQVIVFGRRRGTGESIWQLKKQIGWVSPELQLHFDDQLSVIDAVLSGFYDTIGVFEEMTARQLAAARRWLGRFDLKQYAFAPLFSLSAGLQRMTLLARALVKQPRLLILDEPCQGLDPVHRDLIVNQVDRLIRAGSVSAIFVTHRLEEIPASIELVLRLSKGQSAQMSATPNRRESKSEGIAEPGLPS